MAACNDALVRLGLGELPAKWVDAVFYSNFVGTKGTLLSRWRPLLARRLALPSWGRKGKGGCCPNSPAGDAARATHHAVAVVGTRCGHSAGVLQ